MSKGIAKGSFITGLLLIGFGMLVFILRDIFAFLAAGIFFFAGVSSIIYAVKIYIAGKTFEKRAGDPYRENVNVRFEESDWQ